MLNKRVSHIGDQNHMAGVPSAFNRKGIARHGLCGTQRPCKNNLPMTTNRKRPEKEKPTGDRTPADAERPESTGRNEEDRPATEQRYQKKGHDPAPDQDTDDDKRYATRLKPTDYKPSNYLWGYKDPVGDEDRTGGGPRNSDDGPGGENDPATGNKGNDPDPSEGPETGK
jgi:hypothetical protein